jgi:NADPH-dependent curcumin reductase CurA
MKSEIKGFIAFDYASRYNEARAYLADLKSKGKIEYEYHVLEPRKGESGLGRCVEALEGVFEGRNIGKT